MEDFLKTFIKKKKKINGYLSYNYNIKIYSIFMNFELLNLIIYSRIIKYRRTQHLNTELLYFEGNDLSFNSNITQPLHWHDNYCTSERHPHVRIFKWYAFMNYVSSIIKCERLIHFHWFLIRFLLYRMHIQITKSHQSNWIYKGIQAQKLF